MKAFLRRLGRRLLGYIDINMTPGIVQLPTVLALPVPSMNGEDFTISIITAPRAIVIAVSVRRSVVGEVVDAFMTRLASAMARVEAIETAVMEELLFQDRRAIHGEQTLGILVRSEYSDPGYPLRVDRALRDVDINPVDPPSGVV